MWTQTRRWAVVVVSFALVAHGSPAQEISVHALGNAVEALVIEIDGEFDRGTPERFRAFLERERPEAYRIVLNSPGGELIAGLQLGKIIRERGYTTEVGKVVPSSFGGALPELSRKAICASACALTFLGGVERSLSDQASLGFHQFYEVGTAAYSRLPIDPQTARAAGLSKGQILSGIIVAYIVEMGVDARLYQLISSTPSGDLVFIEREEGLNLNVITRDGFGPWFLEPYKEGLVAASKRQGRTSPLDMVTQSTVFCRGAQENAVLMMTAAGGVEQLEGTEDFSVLWTFYDGAGNHLAELTTTRASTRSDSETFWIDLALDDVLREMIVESSTFEAMILVPRIYGGYRISHHKSALDSRMIEAALKLCI